MSKPKPNPSAVKVKRWERYLTIDILSSRNLIIAALIGLVIILILIAQAKGITATLLIRLAVYGIMLGSIIALGAIGLSLVYGVLRFANFSHGELLAVGAYVAFGLMAVLPQGKPLRPLSFGWEFLVALVVAMVATGAVAYGIDWVLFRHLRKRRSPQVILAMSALGAAFFVRSIIYLAWGADFRFYYWGRPRPAWHLPLGIRFRPDQLFILGLALVLVVLLYLLLERTKMGKAMRATADNPELARVTGIDTARVIRWTWMIGGGLAAAGGVLLGLDAQLRPEMGWWMLLPMFAAVILGGIGNPYGALAGGLIIGMAQQLSTAFIKTTYKPGVAFLIMIVILLIRPQGIFGRRG
jgi:branched-chain amino acid transport system permease protein/neutral amino acid transport system permease protein